MTKTAAEIAYRLAEERIARARKTGATVLSLSEDWTENGEYLTDYDARLGDLETLPPEIKDLSGLATLYLSYTQVSDLSPIAGLTGLRHLEFVHTQVSDLTPLAGMVALESLNCGDTPVRDLSPIAGLTQLTSFDCGAAEVSDLAPLAAMTQMRALTFSSTDVSDLTPLAGMTALRSLNCIGALADLSALTAPGAAWEEEDRDLLEVLFAQTPATDEGGVLASLAREAPSAEQTARALALLRKARDAGDVG